MDVELVLLPALLVLGLVLLPEAVLGVSFRTCFVTLSQHFTLPGEAALDEGDVVEEVWATASPKLAVSIAAAINPVPAIRMRDPSLVRRWRAFAITGRERQAVSAVPRRLVTKKARRGQRGSSRSPIKGRSGG